MSYSPHHRNRRILVIDDNLAIHADFKKILSPAPSAAALEALEAEVLGHVRAAGSTEGFQVDSALQGQEGFALVQQSLADRQPYALVFMDVRMPPGWDGIETTARIWEIDPDIEVVICTAYSDYSWDDMIARLGISDRLVILKKPFDNVEVLQMAHALTEKWSLRQKVRLKMDQLEAMVAARTRELQAANEQLKVEMAERARTEEALRQSQKMEALGQLAGGIAHDFNNLLTVIRGNAQIMALDVQELPAVLEACRQIDRAAERAAKLTAQMLMFSRKKRMRSEHLDLNAVLAQSGRMLPRLLNEDIAVEIQCGAPALPVCADPVMVEQAILNLAVNARDAMPNGGRLTIQADAVEISDADARSNPKSRAGRFARVTVADTGSGIAPEALPHLFEPFFTTKEPGRGTGLGLATVYGIVKQHAGWVDVESEPGRGARFRIFLPLNGSGAASAAAASPENPVIGGTETILLVEDEPPVRRLARTILQRHGYRVLEAGSGEEALAVWAEHESEISLLLTDMVMPGHISGRELAARLREKKPELKATFTTGYSVDTIGKDMVLEEGLNFLPKPYHPRKLAETVRRCLDEPPPESDKAANGTQGIP
jgi:two-component system, NtrC family, sensor kinase